MRLPKLLWLLWLIPFCNAVAMSSHGLDVKLQTITNNYLAQHAKAEDFSAVSVSVLLPNTTTPRNYVAGTQTKLLPIPATPHMLVQYGSITKGFTSVLVLQLVDQGKLSLKTTLAQILPEKFSKNNPESWPAAWESVTVKQLLNMTSGITTYANNPAIFDKINPNKHLTFNELINLAANYQKIHGCSVSVGCFSPGSQWYYSNTNYIIAGLIVEKLTGMYFSNVMAANILGPFQANNIPVYYALRYPANILVEMIHGYMESKAGIGNPYVRFGADVTDIPLYWAASAGGLTGSTGALTKMIYALFNNRFIKSTALTTQGLVQTATGKPVTDIKKQCTKRACYGLGVTVQNDPKYGENWAYEGGTFGYLTYYYWNPKEKVVIVLSQNSSSDSTNFGPTLTAINQAILAYLSSNKVDNGATS